MSSPRRRSPTSPFTILPYDDRAGRRLIDAQLKYVRAAVLAGHVEVELSTPDIVQIQGRGEYGFALEMWAGEDVAQRADDGAAAAHQHRVGRIAKRHTHGLGKIPLADKLARAQDEAAPFQRDVLHRRQPRVSIIGGGSAVQSDVLCVHRHAQHRHVVLPTNHRTDSTIRAVHHRERRAIAEAPDRPFQGGRHQLAMLAVQTAIRPKEQYGAVTGAELAFDHADQYVDAVRRCGLPQALRLWSRDLDRRVELQSEFFAPDRIARAHHQTIVEPFGIPADECFREEDHLCPGGSGFSDQTHCLVDTGFRVERYGPGLYHGNLYVCLLHSRSHLTVLGQAGRPLPSATPEAERAQLHTLHSPLAGSLEEGSKPRKSRFSSQHTRVSML